MRRARIDGGRALRRDAIGVVLRVANLHPGGFNGACSTLFIIWRWLRARDAATLPQPNGI